MKASGSRGVKRMARPDRWYGQGPGILGVLFGVFFSTGLMAAQYEFNMSIEEVKIHVAPSLDYQVFAFNGQVPGPLIHVKQGDEVTVHVTNNTSLPHTIHWHFSWAHLRGVGFVTRYFAVTPRSVRLFSLCDS